MKIRRFSSSTRPLDFWLLAGFVALVFLTGGSARADVMSLVMLRPVAVVLAVLWAARLTRVQIADNRWFFAFAGALGVLTVLTLVPLPPGLWRALPGRELIAAIDAGAGLGAVWRPLTVAPQATWNAAWSLFVPFAAGLGMVHLDSRQRRAMVDVVLAAGAVSLLLSLLQVALPSLSFLWLYRITNGGSPVGLMANRNHNAALLAALVPVVTAWALATATQRTVAARRVIAVAAVLLIAVVELVSGSRAGIVLFAGALVASALLLPGEAIAWRLPGQRRTRDRAKSAAGTPGIAARLRQVSPRQLALAAAALAVPLAVFVLRARATAGNSIDRLTESGTGDFRPVIWPQTWRLALDNLPLGSGLGSFVETYRAAEPRETIMAQYINHAHNDYLELLLTTGVPGVLLLAALALFVAAQAWSAWRAAVVPGAHVRLARGASLFLAVLAGASAVDYPLRTPAVAVCAVIALFWLRLPRSREA